MIAQQLDNELEAAIAKGGSEPDIIKRYAQQANSLPNTAVLKIRAEFIHQRPYAFFVTPPLIAGKQKCELGDILYVYKEIDMKGHLLKAKIVFVQAKVASPSWIIEPHQLEFLANVKTIQFRFGNNVYKSGGISPVIYGGLPHSGEIAQFLLIDNTSALSYSVKRIKARQPYYQHSFSLNRANAIPCKETKVDFCPNHDSHLAFLDRFCNGKEGARLTGKVRQVTELIYKRIGWVLDPPEEFADNLPDDQRGFAVIEITATRDSRLATLI